MIASFMTPEWLVSPMKGLLNIFFNFTGSYGWAIILLTMTVRIVILPLTIYQMRSMKKMQELQPELKALQEKYKDQPELLNQKMMEFYRSSGSNPFTSCLPLVVQMPFLYALFAVLNGLKLQNVHFLWMNLEKPDIYLAVLTILAMFAQSWLSGMGNDPTQKTMTYVMPLVFGFITFQMHSGVVLYWVSSTLFGLAQQAIYPGFPRLKKAQGAKGET